MNELQENFINIKQSENDFPQALKAQLSDGLFLQIKRCLRLRSAGERRKIMNMKKIVAFAAATVMAMSMSVSAFASITEPDSAGYADAKASYTGTITHSDGTQMSVVVFKDTKHDGTVTADNLEYINQGVASNTLYTGMATKNDLLATGSDGSLVNDGAVYIVRVGYYNATGNWSVAEGSFKVGTGIKTQNKLVSGGYGANKDKYLIYVANLLTNIDPNQKIKITKNGDTTTAKQTGATLADLLGIKTVNGSTLEGDVAIGVLTDNETDTFAIELVR